MDSAQENARKQLLAAIKSKRKQSSGAKQLSAEILEGNRASLSQAITLVESELESDQLLAEEILAILQPHTGNARRIGISGVPGAGKSTFIESFGTYYAIRETLWLCWLLIPVRNWAKEVFWATKHACSSFQRIQTPSSVPVQALEI